MHAEENGFVERISALADGQLDDDEFARTMAWVASSQEARETWHAYHVMGDALRGTALGDCSGDREFVVRLRARLARVDARVDVTTTTPVSVVADAAVRSANDAAQRWKWLAVAASVVTVAVLGWHVRSVGTAPSSQLAGGPTDSQGVLQSGNAEPPVMLRDPRLDELLAAHRQFGGASALQTPSGFLRNATFEQPGR